MSGATTHTAAPDTVGEATRRARAAVAAVTDPEIPVITIEDLGVLRDVTVDEQGRARVTITPTYSGCPAMDEIAADVNAALRGAGFDDPDVRLVLSPAWSTDLITERGREALLAYGIAPPTHTAPEEPVPLGMPRHRPAPRCPQCGSARTTELSRFGSTACKSLHRCLDCLEPFDHVKAL